MSSQRPLYVTLTGDRSGSYVVVKEQPDGSLVLAPDIARGFRRAQPRTPQARNTLLSGTIFTPKEAARTVPVALADWGVDLGEGELVREFLVANVDGRAGFVAVTSQRLVFVAKIGGELSMAQEERLSSARDIDLVRRGMRRKLRVRWDGFEMLIGTSDRKSLARLQQILAVQN
jgi:hypothetical protein